MSMVYCRGCAKQIHETARFCPDCGAPQPGAVRPMVMTATVVDESDLPKVLAASATSAPATPALVDGREHVSAKWQRRFAAIEKAGGPKLPNWRILSIRERMLVGFSPAAGFFGLFWYLAKGMWRKGITLTFIAMLATTLLEIVLTAVFGRAPIGALVGLGAAIYGSRGVKDYYKAVVLGDKKWL